MDSLNTVIIFNILFGNVILFTDANLLETVGGIFGINGGVNVNGPEPVFPNPNIPNNFEMQPNQYHPNPNFNNGGTPNIPNNFGRSQFNVNNRPNNNNFGGPQHTINGRPNNNFGGSQQNINSRPNNNFGGPQYNTNSIGRPNNNNGFIGPSVRPSRDFEDLSEDEKLAAQQYPGIKKLLDKLKEMNRQKEQQNQTGGQNGINNGWTETDNNGGNGEEALNGWKVLRKRIFAFQAKPVKPENEIASEDEVVYYRD